MSEKLLHKVRALVERGERIAAEDCRALFDLHDLNLFSKLSRIVRERLFGREVFLRSGLRAEYRGEDPSLFISEMETMSSPLTAELHITPSWIEGDGLERWLERCKRFRDEDFPVRLMTEADFITRLSEQENSSAKELLKKIAGVIDVHVLSNGAGVLNSQWRAEYAHNGIDSERWLAIHQSAHAVGIPTSGGMTFHGAWNPDIIVDHLSLLREYQDNSGGFVDFVVMPYHDQSPDAGFEAMPTASSLLKFVAITRLFLDNFSHIVLGPETLDPEIAYAGLSYGADTIDTTLRPTDMISFNRGDKLGSGGELHVVEGGDERTGNAMEHVASRIIESRWEAVPVDSNYKRVLLEENV